MKNNISQPHAHARAVIFDDGWSNAKCDLNILPARGQKGRGAVSNIDGRFERHIHQAVDDGWLGTLMEEQDAPRTKTTLGIDGARSVITRNQSPDVPFDRSINPYRGCEHGCVYCFARPTHAYLGLSPGLDFETRLFWKPEAAQLLRKQLSSKAYQPAPIVIGTSTDPYQPVDRDKKLTRSIIEVLSDCQHPFSIITKSALVTRDIDLIAPMATQNRASVAVSVTSLDHRLSNLLEPRASAPHRRLDAIRQLSDAGIPVAVLCAPIIPGLNDMEIEKIVAACKEAGAQSISHIVLRLPLEIADLFEEWLDAHYPDRKAKVMSLIRQMRDGETYQSEFGTRMRGTGPIADLIAKRFDAARKKHGLVNRSLNLDCSGFKRPSANGQMSLF
ncbi:PA0069 family radical SAM protein [Thalassospira sp.]|uniref:PA0069 family radical SAM protein n=1 Tax=Thalassospira sp. TaxID=1912094 RepID=UPI001B2E2964|nr:PA0069 family radical SAM protein [Thalassospira sp.]MBO6807513.1 PA0069 family radical SAM protein [Thalassospira sp.]MBO6840038.1 PA0069 family radical SAM protein [Thalassospira sp.]